MWEIFGAVVAQVPFTGHVSVISAVAKHLSERYDLVIQVSFVTRFAFLLGRQHLGHVAETGDVIICTGHQHRASRRATHRSVEIAEPHTLLGQDIEVGCLNLASKTSNIRVAHIITHNEQDIRSFVGSFSL